MVRQSCINSRRNLTEGYRCFHSWQVNLDLYSSLIKRSSERPRCISTSSLTTPSEGLVIIALVSRLWATLFLIHLLVHIVLPLLFEGGGLRGKVSAGERSASVHEIPRTVGRLKCVLDIPRKPPSPASCAASSERPEPITPISMSMIM